MQQPTHTERADPQLSAARLADYMGASEQARRGIIQSCKYRSTARVVQHSEARAAISSALLKPELDANALKDRADFIRNKLADTDFEADVNGHNADYVERFLEVSSLLALPVSEISAGVIYPPLSLVG